jgi:hypothetical protein
MPAAPAPLNPELIFRQALNFDYCASILTNATAIALKDRAKSLGNWPSLMPDGETYCVTVPMGEVFSVPPLIPTLVLQSFATELYLKCLLVVSTGTAPHGHKLEVLYGQLSVPLQTRMSAIYDEEAANDDAFQQLKEAEPTKDFGLLFALQEMNNSFEKWRYAYEVIPPKSFLGRPWVAAAKLILGLRPEWVPLLAPLGTPPTFQDR